MLCRTNGRITPRSTKHISTSNLVVDTIRATASRPSLFVSPRPGGIAHARQALPQVVQGILFVLPAPLERPQAGIPLVMSPEAETGPGHPEGGVSPRQIRLRVDDLQDSLRLGSLDATDKRPQQMQAELHIRRRGDSPTPVRLSASLGWP